VNRADLSFALSAVLPHCGKTAQTELVGLEYLQGVTYVYATDTYTLGIARITEGAADIDIRLPRSEATDLMRFVRPGNKAEQVEELAFGRRDGEFHVGYGEEKESEVYEVSADRTLTLSYLFEYVDRLTACPFDWDEAIYQPKIMERFAKAHRVETDRLRLLPRRVIDRNGAAVVSVGTDFIGAVAGLTYDDLGTATVADFLNLTTKEKAA
jgi:hypothetical protein